MSSSLSAQTSAQSPNVKPKTNLAVAAGAGGLAAVVAGRATWLQARDFYMRDFTYPRAGGVSALVGATVGAAVFGGIALHTKSNYDDRSPAVPGIAMAIGAVTAVAVGLNVGPGHGEGLQVGVVLGGIAGAVAGGTAFGIGTVVQDLRHLDD